jgi:hypothetical protein
MSLNSSLPNPNSLFRAATSPDFKLSRPIVFAGFFLVPNGIHRGGETYLDEHLENVALARQVLEAFESGPTGDKLAQFFAPKIVLEILRSKFFPNGSRDDLAGILGAAERCKKPSRPHPRSATPSIDRTAWPPLWSRPSRPQPRPRSSPDTFGHTAGLSLR